MQMAQTNQSSVNDILGQARQGSVAAIIQVLNEELMNEGIRTRAILADGVLELLCEGQTPDKLEQSTVVSRVQEILERLSPRNIRKVNINSRIVREQQLLWYEEITRDPENQLLWSQLIKLKQPNPLQRFWQDMRQPKGRLEIAFTDSKRKKLTQQYFLRGLVGGASLCMLLFMLGWVLKHRLGVFESQSTSGTPIQVPAVSPETSGEAAAPQDVFAQAVRLAEQAAADGQTAETLSEWLDLAARWQRASELMGQVSADDPRYEVAQDRVVTYQQNSDRALAEADKLQPQPTEGDDLETESPE